MPSSISSCAGTDRRDMTGPARLGLVTVLVRPDPAWTRPGPAPGLLLAPNPAWSRSRSGPGPGLVPVPAWSRSRPGPGPGLVPVPVWSRSRPGPGLVLVQPRSLLRPSPGPCSGPGPARGTAVHPPPRAGSAALSAPTPAPQRRR